MSDTTCEVCGDALDLVEVEWCEICDKARCTSCVRQLALPGDMDGYGVCRSCRDRTVKNGWVKAEEIIGQDFRDPKVVPK